MGDRYYPHRPHHGHQPAYEFGRSRRQQNEGREAYNDAPGNFNFRMSTSNQQPRFHEPPPGHNQPSQPARDRARNGKDSRRDRSRGGARGGRNGGGGRGRYAPPPTSSRPLLSGERAPTPEQIYGANDGEARFKKYEDLSDSEEQDMDLESGSEDGEQVQPPVKKARLENETSATNVPKWSNPDPYFVLPPTDETAGSKKDVVKMIRKAKASAAAPQTKASHSDDFISFNFDDDNEKDDSSLDSDDSSIVEVVSPNARGDRFSHLDNLHGDRYVPSEPTSNGHAASTSRGTSKAIDIDTWPPPEQPVDGADNSNRPTSDVLNFRGRKRGAAELEDDRTEFEGRKRRGLNNGLSRPFKTPLHPDWRIRSNTDSTPWMVRLKQASDLSSILSAEIQALYDWLRPIKAENEARTQLVAKVQAWAGKEFPGATITAFGSFATGSYLPQGDMDLVLRSSNFMKNGQVTLCKTPSQLYKLRDKLQRALLAKPGSVNVIAHAKVPIIKYTDVHTGFKVDICFENDSGMGTTHTCDEWRAAFPTLPIIVTLIKQLLLMRDLNDVATGGMGGFSITCLIVSFLQRNLDLNARPTNIGKIFMAFLDYYGNKFNYETWTIHFNPPDIIRKSKNTTLTIWDPNNPNNDISRSTWRIDAVFKAFSDAHAILKDEISLLRPDFVNTGHSILRSVYAGNYQPYTNQRNRMLAIYTKPNRGSYVGA